MVRREYKKKKESKKKEKDLERREEREERSIIPAKRDSLSCLCILESFVPGALRFDWQQQHLHIQINKMKSTTPMAIRTAMNANLPATNNI